MGERDFSGLEFKMRVESYSKYAENWPATSVTKELKQHQVPPNPGRFWWPYMPIAL